MKKTLEEYAKEYAEASGIRPDNQPKVLAHFIKTCKKFKLSEEKIIALIRRAKISEKMAQIADDDWSEERYQDVIESEIAWGDDP